MRFVRVKGFLQHFLVDCTLPLLLYSSSSSCLPLPSFKIPHHSNGRVSEKRGRKLLSFNLFCSCTVVRHAKVLLLQSASLNFIFQRTVGLFMQCFLSYPFLLKIMWWWFSESFVKFHYPLMWFSTTHTPPTHN